jgi:hypothetical protein
MEKNKYIINIIILSIIIISLIFASSEGVFKRIANENSNDVLVTIFDYYNFEKKAIINGHIMDDVVDDMLEHNINSVLIKEMNLEDLKNKGYIDYGRAGLYLSSLSRTEPVMTDQIKNVLEWDSANPYGFLISTIHDDISDLLFERLTKRYNEGDFKWFKIDNIYYYYISKNIDSYRLVLGFDDELIEDLYEKGFKIILMPYNMGFQNFEYIQEYLDLIKKYDIKSVIFESPVITGYPENIGKYIKLFNEEVVMTALIESFFQFKYIQQEGLNEIISGTDYKITRVYIMSDGDLTWVDSETLAAKWFRAVVDRGIRLILIRQANNNVSYSKNYSSTINAIDIFNKDIEKYNYNQNGNIKPMDTEKAGVLHEIYIILLLTCLIFIYLMIVPIKNIRLNIFLGLLFSLGLIFLKYILGRDIEWILSLSAAIIIPSILTLVILKSLKMSFGKYESLKYILFPLFVVGMGFLGGYIITTSLYEVKYLQNLQIFRGVKIAFIIPMFMFVINYIICFSDFKSIMKVIKKYLGKSLTYIVLALIGLFSLIIFLYIGRSGNAMAFLVSDIEIQLREILEKLFFARPRFKEFLFGYPALITIIYIYNKYQSKVAVLLSGFFITSLIVSIVNTFSHTAAHISLSIIRVLSGAVIGIIIGLFIVLLLKVGEIIINYARRKGIII